MGQQQSIQEEQLYAVKQGTQAERIEIKAPSRDPTIKPLYRYKYRFSDNIGLVLHSTNFALYADHTFFLQTYTHASLHGAPERYTWLEGEWKEVNTHAIEFTIKEMTIANTYLHKLSYEKVNSEFRKLNGEEVKPGFKWRSDTNLGDDTVKFPAFCGKTVKEPWSFQSAQLEKRYEKQVDLPKLPKEKPLYMYAYDYKDINTYASEYLYCASSLSLYENHTFILTCSIQEKGGKNDSEKFIGEWKELEGQGIEFTVKEMFHCDCNKRLDEYPEIWETYDVLEPSVRRLGEEELKPGFVWKSETKPGDETVRALGPTQYQSGTCVFETLSLVKEETHS